jgi:hypothetical protein
MQDDGPIEGDQSDFLFVILVWKKKNRGRHPWYLTFQSNVNPSPHFSMNSSMD